MCITFMPFFFYATAAEGYRLDDQNAVTDNVDFT